MRYVLNAGRDAGAEVALEDELRFVRHYLALEHLRLGDRLRVVENIDAETLELAVPPLLLQPLVENAVRHGIAPRRQGGTIRLTTRDDDGKLVVEIADDGPGADPDAWRNANGLGLKAVRRQMNARFPKRGELTITTAPDTGFTACVTVPARVPVRHAS
jgi:LytS/YehU family sensor histidine kinase